MFIMVYYRMNISLAFTRFTNETSYENNEWKREHAYNGCIYGVPKDIVCDPGRHLIVIEMNIDSNKIIGFGKIRNIPDYSHKYNIYKYGYYNRKIFKGKCRIDITEITDQYCLDSIAELEKILFYGKTHVKRGIGIQILKTERVTKHKDYNFAEIFKALFHHQQPVAQ